MDYTISQIRQLLLQNGFSFKKELGQNFLVDPNICPRMAAACGCGGIGVIEVGPGAGMLTRELAKVAKKVVAVEIDQRLKPVLEAVLQGYDNAFVVYGDILELDIPELINEHFEGMEVVLCANLPYNISSAVVMRALSCGGRLNSLTVMLQKEMAMRICAAPPGREVGAISLAVHYYSLPKSLFSVPAGCFFPAPKVDSRVIRLDVYKEPPVRAKSEEMFFTAVRAAFSQRRKTISNSLSQIYGKETALFALEAAGISPGLRAEQLSVAQFCAVADALLEREDMKWA